MDNRKLRYAKRKAKEKILSQRDRAYYRNLHFRKNPNEQAEASPEHYAAQNASLYGRKYAGAVKEQGRKLLIAAKGKGTAEQKASRTRRTGRNHFFFGKHSASACRKESRHAKKRQNYYIKHKTAAKFAGASKKASSYFLCPARKRIQ